MSPSVLLALLLSEPGVWIPVPRPIIAVSVESPVVHQKYLATSDVVAALAGAVSGRRLLVRPIEAGEIEACKVSVLCRLNRAAAMRASHMLLLYLQNDEDSARLDLELYDVLAGMRAAGAGKSEAEVEDAARLKLSAEAALVVRATDEAGALATKWIQERLAGTLSSAGMELMPSPVVLDSLPKDALLRVVDGTETSSPGADRVELQALPPGGVEIEISAEDYLSRRLLARRDVSEIDASLPASPLRWVRRGVFGIGVGAILGGAASLVAAGVQAGATRATCIRAETATCPKPLVGGDSIHGASAWVPLSVGIAAGGVGIASEALFRGEPEASWPGFAVGILLGAIGAAVASQAGVR